jgi:Flp pilus assembly CpaE family ATPase
MLMTTLDGRKVLLPRQSDIVGGALEIEAATVTPDDRVLVQSANGRCPGISQADPRTLTGKRVRNLFEQVGIGALLLPRRAREGPFRSKLRAEVLAFL